MIYYQLFKEKPSLEFINKLLKFYGLYDIYSTNTFSKSSLRFLKSVESIKELLPELEVYYMPCKAKLYLKDLNEKKIITILKHFLKCYEVELLSSERYINKKKELVYKLSEYNPKFIIKFN